MSVKSINVDNRIGAVSAVLSKEQKQRGLLIQSFHRMQEEHNYLPEEELRKLGQKLELPMSVVYSTASFYKQFYFTPRGRKVVQVCMGTACHVRGAGEVLRTLEEEFGIGQGETTEDLAMTLETVGCVGCCGLAPVATVNQDVLGEIDDERIDEIIESVKEE